MNRQQNGRISKSERQEVVTLVMKDSYKGNRLDHFWPITPLNTDAKSLVNVLVKCLAHFADRVIGEVQICAVPGRTIHDNLHNICYALERSVIVHQARMGALIYLVQAKAFDRVDHRHMYVLAQFVLSIVFPRRTTKLYNDIDSIVQANGFLFASYARFIKDVHSHHFCM